MSRFLSEALGANEPKFRQAVMALERRSGHENHDIRLSSEIVTKVRSKLSELGLDPDDTTAKELYYCLNHNLAEQDKLLNKKVRTLAAKKVNAEANIDDGLAQLIKSLKLEKLCFSLKPTVLKQQIKASVPKKTMKALGYRSVDSMLKLEPMALILLAINNFESEAYLSSFYSKYKKFDPSCFETRKLSIIMPRGQKWQSVLSDIKEQTGLSLVSSYELASVIIMPVGNEPDPGYLSALIASLLSELSIISSISSYLKLHQVGSDFSAKFVSIVRSEPYLEIRLLEFPVSLHAAQHVFSESDNELYAPHMSTDELKPTNLLAKLGDVLGEFKFWEDSEYLALVQSAETTSLNILDVASNLASALPFNRRKVDHFRSSLTQEIVKLYLTPEHVLKTLSSDQELGEIALTSDKVQVG